MRGGDAISSMITTLKSNDRLVKRNKIYRKKDYFDGSRTIQKTDKDTRTFEKSNPRMVEQIRLQTIERRKRTAQLMLGLKILLAILLTTGIYTYLHSPVNDRAAAPVEEEKKEVVVVVDTFAIHMKEGKQFLYEQNYAEAIDAFEEAEKFKPDHITPEKYLAKAFCLDCVENQNNCPEAVEEISEVISHHPQYSMFYQYRADCFKAQGNMSQFAQDTTRVDSLNKVWGDVGVKL